MSDGLSGKWGSVWQWLGASKDQLTIIFALVAGLTTLYQYREARDHDRRLETIEFIKRYYSDSHIAARADLNGVLLNKKRFEEFLRIIEHGSGDDLLAFAEKNKMVTPISKLVEFYDSLAICVLTDGCDKEVACSYFDKEIAGHYHNFRRLFEGPWKKMWGEDFMKRAYTFSKSCESNAVGDTLPRQAPIELLVRLRWRVDNPA